jgi:dTDP-glucose 4,6-dehydratase
MRVAITGAAGFIGSHLVERYLSDGHSVIGIDNLITGTRKNIQRSLKNGCFRFIEHNVAEDWSPLESALAPAESIDLVLHFASPASPVDYAALPIETLHVNSRGTENALKFAVQRNARFLFASTSETYGDPLVHPQTEAYWGNVNPVGVRSCYDESKRFGEAMTMAYIRAHGADARIIRIFNTYGPRMRIDDGRVVPNFIKQALQGEPLTVYGDGAQTRSFCYVDDLVEGIVRCAGSPATRGLVVNLGNPDERTIREFAEMVCRVSGATLNTVNVKLPEDDPARRCPDITHAKRLLNWEPRVSLQDGLKQTVEYFRSVL